MFQLYMNIHFTSNLRKRYKVLRWCSDSVSVSSGHQCYGHASYKLQIPDI